MDKLLSIIVPSCNMEAYLPKCLQSLVVDPVLMERLEVVVVNDGSNDRTGEIAHGFEARFPGTFKVIDKENGHYGSCINAALGIVSGKYVKVLDADDSFNTDEFGRWLAAMTGDEPGEDMLLTDFDTVLPDGSLKVRTSCSDYGDKDRQIQMHAVSYRVQMLRDMGYRQTEGIAYTDTEWVFLPVARSKSIKRYPFAVYRYLTGRAGQSMDRNVSGRSIAQLRRVLSSMSDAYRREQGGLSVKDREYLRKCLDGLSRMIYFTGIFNADLKTASAILQDFDAWLKENIPFCYDAAGEMTIVQRIGLPYVKIWRNAGVFRNVVLRILRIYNRMVSVS